MKFFDRNLGLTKAGLEIPSMEEIIRQNYKYLEEKTGKQIDRASDGPIGQLFEISAKFWLDTWKQLQVFVGLFAYPRGIFADWFAGYTGFKRLPAINASAILDVYGKIGADSQLSNLPEFNDINGKSWTRKIVKDGLGVDMESRGGTIQFPRENITSFLINWGEFDAEKGGTFTVTNHRTNVPYSMISAYEDDDRATLQNRFDTVLNKFSIVKNFNDNENFWLCKMPFGEMCGIDDTNMGTFADMVATPYQVYVENKDYKSGEILPAHSINSLASKATNLFTCTNPTAMFRARGGETDLELFRRMRYSRRMYGGCSAVALEQRLAQEVPGVSFCRIMENAAGAPKEIRAGVFMPPKSIMPLIEGGSQVGIANFLFKYVPSNCTVFGVDFQRTRTVQDPITKEYVIDQAIGWNSPKPRHIEVKITILDYHKDNPFPVGGENRIKEEILNWAYGRYGIGEDFILKDLYTPINKVIGTARVLIEQRNAGEDSNWKTSLSQRDYTDNDVRLIDEYVHLNDIQVS
ncbi:MAG: hypothetical protein LBH98_03180 [Chitinispirillales bacterium]|jgi:hypothetical protein|nr:hypothetical protein [Chitinispirillales bacterium]